MAHVTAHAILRYQERVEPVTAEKAREIMMGASLTIDKASAFGCDLIVLGNGARLRLDGDRIVTVLGKRCVKQARHG